MRDYFEPLEADFLRLYGIDLRERIGVRRLRALVQNLPADATVWARLRQDQEEAEAPKPEPTRFQQLKQQLMEAH